MLELVNFEKKPVKVTTTLFSGGVENGLSIQEWIRSLGGDATYVPQKAQWQSDDGLSGHGGSPEQFSIVTLEGEVRADVGDYIIRGVKGEFYPCKPDIFESSYTFPGEVVTEALPVLIESPPEVRTVHLANGEDVSGDEYDASLKSPVMDNEPEMEALPTPDSVVTTGDVDAYGVATPSESGVVEMDAISVNPDEVVEGEPLIIETTPEDNAENSTT